MEETTCGNHHSRLFPCTISNHTCGNITLPERDQLSSKAHWHNWRRRFRRYIQHHLPPLHHSRLCDHYKHLGGDTYGRQPHFPHGWTPLDTLGTSDVTCFYRFQSNTIPRRRSGWHDPHSHVGWRNVSPQTIRHRPFLNGRRHPRWSRLVRFRSNERHLDHCLLIRTNTPHPQSIRSGEHPRKWHNHLLYEVSMPKTEIYCNVIMESLY